MDRLVDLYFKRINLFLPILHRPSFENLLSQGYHLRDPAFGTCVLLVCAVAARHSDDPRVLLDEEIGLDTWLSSGWKYFVQIPVTRRYLLERVSSYDLHYYCVCANIFPKLCDIYGAILTAFGHIPGRDRYDPRRMEYVRNRHTSRPGTWPA